MVLYYLRVMQAVPDLGERGEVDIFALGTGLRRVGVRAYLSIDNPHTNSI